MERKTSLMWIFFAAFAAVIASMVFHPTPNQNKSIDILIVVFSGVFLIPIIMESARSAERNKLSVKTSQLLNLRDHTIWYVSRLESWICRKRVRTEDSPADFDERTEQIELACTWAKNVTNQMATLDPSEISPISTDLLDGLPEGVSHRIILSHREKMLKSINEYNRDYADWDKLNRKLEQPFLELVVVFYGPFFMSIALGMALFRALTGNESA